MSVYIISDLHLHDENQPYLFTPEKEAVFAKLAREVSETNAKLVFNGDILDLTGTEPPGHGLDEFFAELLSPDELKLPVIENARIRRTQSQRVRAIADRFPLFFREIARLHREGRLIWILGNHDCELGSPEAHRELSNILETTTLRFEAGFKFASVLVSAHGNEFDPSNRTEKSCANRGEVITRVLYKAVMPALFAMGMEERFVYALPATRPEEEIVNGIEAHLGSEKTKIFLLAFARLLDRNGYFRGVSSGPMWFLLHQVPLFSALIRHFITPARVRRSLPDEKHLKLMARVGAKRILNQLRRSKQNGYQFVVLGHTHELDWDDHYVNLGTWIDHVRGPNLEQLTHADRSLPIFKIESETKAILYDAATAETSGSAHLTASAKILQTFNLAE